jgi:hypothetical protein
MRWTHPLFHRPAPDVMAPVAASTWEDGPCGSPCWVSIWRRASSTCMAWTSLPPCVIGMEATRCSSGRCGRSPASPARSIPHWSKRVHHSLEELNAERGIRSRACAQSYDHELFCWEYRQELLVDSPGEVDVRRHGGAEDANAVAPRQPQIGSGRSGVLRDRRKGRVRRGLELNRIEIRRVRDQPGMLGRAHDRTRPEPASVEQHLPDSVYAR